MKIISKSAFLSSTSAKPRPKFSQSWTRCGITISRVTTTAKSISKQMKGPILRISITRIYVLKECLMA